MYVCMYVCILDYRLCSKRVKGSISQALQFFLLVIYHLEELVHVSLDHVINYTENLIYTDKFMVVGHSFAQ